MLFRLWLALGWLICFTAPTAADDDVLLGGWSEYPPFSFQTSSSGIERWAGLDVELLNAISARAGVLVVSDETPWQEHIEGIRTGTLDIAPHAVLTPERQEFATFSVPYRTETSVLVLRADDVRFASATSPDELVALFRDRKFRIAAEPGVDFPSVAIQNFMADPGYDDAISRMRAFDMARALINDEIDAFWADRIEIAYLAEALGLTRELKEHPVRISGNLHFMFNKSNVPVQTVIRFNNAIESVLADGTYQELNVKYSFPLLVRLSLDRMWFRVVDLIGTIAFALSGLLIAYRYNYDIFGALLLAALPAIGGGVVRDLISGRGEIAALQDPIYILIVVGLVGAGFVILRIANAVGLTAHYKDRGERSVSRRVMSSAVQVFDAVGLAAFTVTGVVVALLTNVQPLWVWGPILAALTAAGGGILRDITRSDPDIPFLKGELYPEIALIWGLFLSMFLSREAQLLEPNHISVGIILTFFGALLTRLLVIYFKISSPRFS